MANRRCFKKAISAAAFSLLQLSPINSQDIQIEAGFALKGECTADINSTDLSCDGMAIYTQFWNGRQLVNFAARSIATIGFAGRLDNLTNDMIWVDRVYLANNQHEADGSCNMKLGAEGPEAVSCQAILKDGRKIFGRMASATVRKMNGGRRPLQSRSINAQVLSSYMAS